MSIRTYQIYLSTTITTPNLGCINPVNLTSNNNASWQINFKSLFGNDYGKYKRCCVRFHLTSQDFSTSDQANIYDAMAGYLTVNFPSSSSITIGQGLPLGIITGTTLLLATGDATPLPLLFYDTSTLGNVQGIDIPMPSENQIFNIQCRSLTNGNLLIPVAGTFFPHYQILLQFELSDPVE